MKDCVAVFCLLAAGAVSPVSAQEGSVPKGVPRLDHVFVIMMENHAYKQVVGNSNMPFSNKYANSVNSARNYFAVGHPSLTNYLEIVGGSNFGIRDDNSPDWHDSTCAPNISGGTVSLESTTTAICPIYGSGTDAATPVIDYSNETSGPPGDIDIDGKMRGWRHKLTRSILNRGNRQTGVLRIGQFSIANRSDTSFHCVENGIGPVAADTGGPVDREALAVLCLPGWAHLAQIVREDGCRSALDASES